MNKYERFTAMPGAGYTAEDEMAIFLNNPNVEPLSISTEFWPGTNVHTIRLIYREVDGKGGSCQCNNAHT